MHQRAEGNAHEGERDGGHNDERTHIGLELGGHDHIHQDDDEEDQEDHVPEHFLLVLVVTTDVVAQFGRDGGTVHDGLGRSDRLAQGMATRHDTGHGDQTLAVLALDGRRDAVLNDRTQVLDPDRRTHRIVNHDVLHILDAGAELRRIADADVVLLTVLPVVGTHRTIDGRTESRSGCRGRQAGEGEFLAVEIHLVFRGVLVTAEDHLGEVRIVEHLLADLTGQGFRLGEIETVDFQGDGRSTAHHTHTFGDIELVEFRELTEVGTDDIRDFSRRTLAARLAADVDVHRNQVGTIAPHTGEGIVRVGLAEGVAEHLDLRDILLDPLVDAGRNFSGDFLGGTDRKLDGSLETALVALRDELGLHIRNEDHHHDSENGNGGQQHEALVAHAPGNQPGITGGNLVQEAVDRVEDEVIEFTALVLVLKQDGAHHRDQGQGRGRGNDHDDADDEAQLLEHNTGHTGHHGQREEHAEHRQGRRNNGDTDLRRAVDGCFLRFLTPFEVRRHILQDHDGIVHDHTDCNGQCGHRDDVQGVARRKEVHQGSQQGDRDRQDDDQGRFPTAEEDIDHHHNQDEGNHNGPLQGIDGIDDVGRRVHNRRELDVGRQVLLDADHRGLDILDDLDGVVTGLLLDDDLGTADTVGERFLGLLLEAVLDAGDIPKIDGTAAGRIADDQVEQFVRIREFLLDAEGVGLGADIDATARHVAVLGRNHAGQGADGQPVSLQLGRVAIDLDLTLRGTGHGNGTDAADTGERSRHLVVQDLVQGGNALVRRRGHNHNRHIVGAELEDHRGRGAVRQGSRYHVELVAHVVGRRFNVDAVFEFEGEDRDVLPGLGGQVLEVTDAVQGVFQGLRQVVLHILGTRARVGCHDHQDIGFNVREEVDRQLHQGEDTQDGERQEDQERGDRPVD